MESLGRKISKENISQRSKIINNLLSFTRSLALWQALKIDTWFQEFRGGKGFHGHAVPGLSALDAHQRKCLRPGVMLCVKLASDSRVEVGWRTQRYSKLPRPQVKQNSHTEWAGTHCHWEQRAGIITNQPPPPALVTPTPHRNSYQGRRWKNNHILSLPSTLLWNINLVKFGKSNKTGSISPHAHNQMGQKSSSIFRQNNSSPVGRGPLHSLVHFTHLHYCLAPAGVEAVTPGRFQSDLSGPAIVMT